MSKWVDPRIPVEVHWVGKYKVTIFDKEAYEKSLKDYPDDELSQRRDKPKSKPSNFVKKKSLARWNWTKKLEKPLGGKL